MTVSKYSLPAAAKPRNQWKAPVRCAKGIALVACALLASLAACSGSSKILFLPGPAAALNDSTKTIVCVPLDSIAVNYIDKSGAKPDTAFSDSFLLDAANNLLAYVATRHFRPANGDDSTPEELPPAPSAFAWTRASRLVHDTAGFAAMSAFVKQTAAAAGTDLVCVPYACAIKHTRSRPQGWRGGGGPGYDRPESYHAACSLHVQIWNKTGELLYECVGASDASKPVLYSLFKHKSKGEDLPAFARNLYAPPLVRALYMAAQAAMRIPKR